MRAGALRCREGAPTRPARPTGAGEWRRQLGGAGALCAAGAAFRRLQRRAKTGAARSGTLAPGRAQAGAARERCEQLEGVLRTSLVLAATHGPAPLRTLAGAGARRYAAVCAGGLCAACG